MKDRIVEHPGRFRLTPVPGDDGVYDLVAVPGTVTEEGTPLSKATLLTDETARLYGMIGDGTINDVFMKLFSDALHVETGKYTGDGVSSRQIGVSFYPKVVFIFSNSAFGEKSYTKYGWCHKNRAFSASVYPMSYDGYMAISEVYIANSSGFLVSSNEYHTNYRGAPYWWIALG